MRRRLTLPSLLAAVVLALAPTAADAASRTIALPAADERLLDYGAVGALHTAVVQRGLTTRVVTSADDGRSFSTLPDDPGLTQRLRASVEPDGRRWVVGTVEPAGQALLVAAPGAPQAAEVRRFPDAAGLSAPVVSAGRRFLAEARRQGDGSSRLLLHRLDDAGGDAGVRDLGAAGGSNVRLTVDGQGLWITSGRVILRLDAEERVTTEAYQADTTLLGDGIRAFGSAIYRPVSPEVWWLAEEVPISAARFSAVEGGALALGFNGGERNVLANPVVVSDPETYGARGEPAGDALGLLSATNALRRQQGLPTLIGDPVAGRAARAHAAYDRRWNEGADETPGRAGFSGEDVEERCLAVGLVCDDEVQARDRPPSGAVADWWASPLLRTVASDPDQVAAGAAHVADASGSTSVLTGAPGVAVTVAPVGLPRGDWNGALAVIGGDPPEGCAARPRAGLGVTAYAYSDPATGERWDPGPVTLVDESGTRRAVPGCAAEGAFLPDAALAARRTYRASTTYTAISGTRPYTWSFRTGADPAGETAAERGIADAEASEAELAARLPAASRAAAASTCLTRLVKGRATVARVRRGLAVALRSCRTARATLTLRRGPRTLLTTRVALRAGVRRTVRLRGRIRPGRHVLRVSIPGAARSLPLVVGAR